MVPERDRWGAIITLTISVSRGVRFRDPTVYALEAVFADFCFSATDAEQPMIKGLRHTMNSVLRQG